MLRIERALLVLVGMALAAAWVLFRINLNGGMVDYRVFDLAGEHWRAPYDQAVYLQREAFGGKTAGAGQVLFAYPPTFLLLAKPFSLLAYAPGLLAWVTLGYGAFVLAASYLHLRAAWLLVISPIAVVFFVGFGGPVIHHPILDSIGTGQTSLWTGAGLIAAGLLLDRKPALAGVLLAIVACIKPTAALVAPFVLWGRWKGLAAAILTGLGLIALTLPLGPQLWLDWLNTTRAFEGGTYQLQPAAAVDHIAWAGVLIALGIWFALTNRQLPALLVGGVLCTPYLMPYDLAALTALGAAWVMGARKHWQLAAAGAALLLGLVVNATVLVVVCLVAVLMLTAPRAQLGAPVTAPR